MSPFVLDFPGLSESVGLPDLPDKLGLSGLAAGRGAAGGGGGAAGRSSGAAVGSGSGASMGDSSTGGKGWRRKIWGRRGWLGRFLTE